ncbi:MAG: DUF2958 domain-containing protein [Planctomycetota bacterium]|jgi:hypothetical protein
MAWRPSDQLIEGELDNSVQGKVTGWLQFAGMKEKMMFNLEGNFHRDIRGAKIRLRGEGDSLDVQKVAEYMQGFSAMQTGKVGDMTAGRPPQDYAKYPYFEWYSEDNGRCVLELEPEQVELMTQPIPAIESDPINRKDQAENMAEFLSGMAEVIGIPQEHAITTGNSVAVERAKKVSVNNRIRGMKLLPQEIRQALPALRSQDGKGGKAEVYVKFFTPDSNWTWYSVEGEAVIDESGQELDFQFFGLVEGFEKELGYFNLSELEEVRGPLGLPIERDLYWTGKTLEQIAPELFQS